MRAEHLLLQLKSFFSAWIHQEQCFNLLFSTAQFSFPFVTNWKPTSQASRVTNVLIAQLFGIDHMLYHPVEYDVAMIFASESAGADV